MGKRKNSLGGIGISGSLQKELQTGVNSFNVAVVEFLEF